MLVSDVIGEMLMGCKHNIITDVQFNFLEDTGKYCADIRISCVDCGEKFRFLGLPVGLDADGAAVSADGLEARLAITPQSKSKL